MALLTTQLVNRNAGVQLVTVSATAGAGDTWANATGREVLYINNASGSSITATVAIPFQVDGVSISTGKQFTIPAGQTKLLGPFPPGIYTDVNGFATVTYSAVTTVSVAVIQVDQAN